MYYKEIRTGKIVELNTHNGKVVKTNLEGDHALEQVEKDIELKKEEIKEKTIKLREELNTLKYIKRQIIKDNGKWKKVNAYQSETDALQLAKELESEGVEAKVVNAHHLSDDFKQGRLWVTKTLVKEGGKKKND